MRARTGRRHSERAGLIWLAAAAWAVGRPAAWAQGTGGFRGSRGGRPARWVCGPARRLRPEKIEEIYRRVLADWSAGQTDRAPDELIELETAVVQDTDPRTRTTLLKAEQAVIHQVGAADLEVLVPIAMLHHESLPAPAPARAGAATPWR